MYFTPIKVLVDGPFVELNNRVLRMYAKKAEHFMRGTFCCKGNICLLLP